MVSATPTSIIESNVDWPAIIASISTGIAAVAGIAGTIWQASRNWNHDDRLAKLNEKRRIYASCLTVFNTGLQAAILVQIRLRQVEKLSGRIEKTLQDASERVQLRVHAEALQRNLQDEIEATREKYTIQSAEYSTAFQACMTAHNELMLLAPNEVGNSAAKVIMEIQNYPREDVKPPQLALAQAMADLTGAMRTDLGESPLNSAAVTVLGLPQTDQ